MTNHVCPDQAVLEAYETFLDDILVASAEVLQAGDPKDHAETAAVLTTLLGHMNRALTRLSTNLVPETGHVAPVIPLHKRKDTHHDPAG